jgi:hypothetical protein
MIRVVHPGSGFRILIFPDPGVKKAPDPGSGSATLISNNNFPAGPSHGKLARNKQKPITVGFKIFNKSYSFISWKQSVD